MKKYINKIVLLASVVLLATSCSLDTKMFEASDSFVAFKSPTVIVSEKGSLKIPIVVAALKGSPSMTVTVQIVDGTAVNDSMLFQTSAFIVDTTQVTFADGFGTQYITINPIDDHVFTGNRTFTVKLLSNSEGLPFGAINEVKVTIMDDEHPLAKWIGTYSVACASYGKPGEWDEVWTVTTVPDPSDVNNLITTGISKSAFISIAEPNTITATLDMVAMTISIKGGQEIKGYGYSLGIYLGTEDLSSVDKSAKIIGTISNDGSIHIDHLSPMIIAGAYAGSIWDTFNTTWTKQ